MNVSIPTIARHLPMITRALPSLDLESAAGLLACSILDEMEFDANVVEIDHVDALITDTKIDAFRSPFLHPRYMLDDARQDIATSLVLTIIANDPDARAEFNHLVREAARTAIRECTVA